MIEQEVELVWNDCLAVIKDNVSNQSYRTWFEPIKPVKLSGAVLTIQVPSQFFFEWLEEHYVSLLHKTIKRALGQEGRLEYRIVMENNLTDKPYTVNMPGGAYTHKNQAVNTSINIANSVKNPFIIPGLRKINIDSQLQNHYTFERFVQGECNRLAASAGMAVAEKPGETAFNPLMLYGGTGLGKTHLAHAIGNRIKQLHMDKTVLYVRADTFTNQFIESLRTSSVNDFVNFYQLIDVLIVDDIHFFANKDKTQDVFFSLFNHLQQAKKQIILTSDKPPKDLKGMEERLLSRFKWGLTADLQLPDFETRVSILKSKMYNDGIELPDETIDFIAANINSNVRDLEGALISLMAHASLNRKQPDLDLAKKVMQNLVRHVALEMTPENIQHLVCDFFNVDRNDVMSKSRKREIAQARQVAIYLTKSLTDLSLKAIGQRFGGRDHSTVIHSIQAVEDLIKTDRNFKQQMEEIQKKVKMAAS